MAGKQIAFDKNSEEIQEIILRCMESNKEFAKILFPEEVESDFSMLHDQVYAVIDSPQKKKAIAAPRGLGKTTIAKLRVIRAIVFREVSFIVYLSNTVTSAIEQTEHIKRLLQEDLITQFFGPVTFSQKGFREGFSKDSWVAYGDVYVLPRGKGQQVRGKNWMGKRPGLIVVDDLENAKEVQSEDQRTELKRWFFSDLLKTESRYGESAEILYIDTIKHEDALLQNLIDSIAWQSVSLSICDDKFNTYDPNYMTTEEIKQSYAEHKETGETDLFYMEYMNIPISLKDAAFKQEYFKYFTEESGRLKVIEDGKEVFYPTNRMTSVVLVDPARTVKMHSAESAVVTVSVEPSAGKIFVRDVFSDKVTPDGLYQVMFDAVVMFRAHFLAVETTGLSQFIDQPIESQMRQRSIYPQYVSLSANRKKEERVATLVPNYRYGYMYHNANNCQALENQLLWFPKSKLWDVMDALAYINKVMDEHQIYFEPQDDIDLEDEFDELEDDEPLMENWRVA